MNLFLDSETTGKPESNFHWSNDYMKYPYIVSLAWKIRGKEKSFLIDQEGRKMSDEVIAIHGITNKMANDKKVVQPASFVYSMLIEDADSAANIIGHNIYFDVSIFKANVLRLFGPDSKMAKKAEEVLDKEKRVDTMRGSMSLFGKWPKLIDLHQYLFKEPFKAHNALADVLAVERCYNELRKRKIM